MNDLAFLRPWITFAGGVLVLLVLSWARVILEPIALAILLAFLLAPIVGWLQRWIGRVPAVVSVTVLVAAITAATAWGLTRQVSALAEDLPVYRANIIEKLRDIRRAQDGASLKQFQRTVRDIQEELATSAEPGAARRPVSAPATTPSTEPTSVWDLSSYMDPVARGVGFAGLVAVLAIFMLLEREDLRARLLRRLRREHLVTTTKAFDEAGRRISRYLLIQLSINLIFGIAVCAGLWAIGVPLPLLWGALATVLRFIPYIGPLMAAGAPILVSFAALPGWQPTLLVVALFTGLELVTNLVLETYLFAGAAGVSQTGLLIAVAMWTWLWGPLGLVLATPLTVCIVVLGKYIPSLRFLTALMADGTLEDDRQSNAA